MRPWGQPGIKGGIRGANKILWPRCFQIGVTLDALLEFPKSGGMKGDLKGRP
jgi:hypothetical protein